MSPYKASSLPPIGFICDERVVGWLYTTNSTVALIDGVVANPDTIPSLRRESLQKLCTHLVEVAFELGHTNIIAVTSHPSIQSICKTMGFTLSPHLQVWALREKD
jgi:hypothetical protein